MNHLGLLAVLALSLMIATGCKKDAEPESAKANAAAALTARSPSALLEQSRDRFFERCRSASPEALECAVNAKTLEDLGGCRL
ncbi:MAG: hypothetical protein ACI9OJ_000667 [Myxococcota bacterium]|jgi:hypothetical protein